jgi:hypothetical protein
LASDTAGDPIFIGIQDTVAEITSLVFVLTSCTGTGCDVNDFAVDTLISKNPGVLLLQYPNQRRYSFWGVH